MSDVIALGLFLLLSGLGLWSLALVQVGIFSLPLLLVGGALFALVVVWQWRRRQVKPAPAPNERGEWIAVAVLLLGSLLLYAHPAEYVVGGGGAGVYVSLAANIAKTGAILVQDPLTAGLSEEVWPGFLRSQPPSDETDFLRFPGFYLSEEQRGELIPQFFPLHPVWLAIAYAFTGLQGALMLTPLWAVLGVWAFYLLGRALFGWKTAAIAAVFLAVTPLQIYFARYPTAEPLTQYLTWTGLWCFTNFVTYRSPRSLWGIAAGLALGQVFLARIDAVPMLLAPAAWLLYLFVKGQWRRDEWSFWITFSAIILYSVFHALWYSAPYTFNTYRAVWVLATQFWWLAIGLGLLVATLALVARGQESPGQRLRAWLAAHAWRLRVACAIGVGVLAFYAYFLRPALGVTSLVNYWYAGTQVPFSNHENLVRLGWYLTPVGIGLATVGAMLLILYGNWRLLWPWWLVGGAFTLLYVYNIMNNPFQIYAMRRYVPVVVPTLILAATYALTWMWSQLRWRHLWQRRLLRASAVFMGGLWFAGLLINGRLIWNQIEYAGVSGQLATLAGQFPKNAILLFVDPAPVGLGDVIGTPLYFLYDIPAYDLQEEQLTEPGLSDQIRRWQAEDRALFLIRKPGTPLPLDEDSLVTLGEFHLTFPLLEQSYEHPPSFSQEVDLAIEVYGVPAEPE